MTKTEKISHWAVVIIAVSAVIVSIWQVRLSQRHNQLSVRPYLDFFSGYQEASVWEVTLTNEGVGPAILQKMEVTYKGETRNNWDFVLQDSLMRKIWLNSAVFAPPSPFAANKEITLLKLNREEVKGPLGIKVRLEYESIYEEKFDLDMEF